ncbi:MAG: glycosyltransferase family 4 protein [Candidatus Caldarchaeum sp.]
MKILHLGYVYPPVPKVADGITNTMYLITKELARRGHRISVYASNLLDLHALRFIVPGSYSVNNVDVHYMRSWLRYKTFTVTPSMFLRLASKLREFDVIHIHDALSFQGVAGYLANRGHNIPLVFQPHGSYRSPLPTSLTLHIVKTLLQRLVGDRILRNSTRIICVSRFEANMYRAMGVPEEKIRIVPNGVDLLDFKVEGEMKTKFEGFKGKKIVLFLGRLHKVKGVDILIKAFSELLHKMSYKDAILVIAGPDDGYLKQAKHLVNSLNLTNYVKFIGPLYLRDKVEAFKKSDVFVVPSRYEIFGLTVLEAYACQKPVIASDVGGLNELVLDNRTGLLFKNGEFTQLAQHIHHLLTHPDLAREMGRNGRCIVEKFYTIEKTVDKLEAVYEELATK